MYEGDEGELNNALLNIIAENVTE